MSSRQPASRQRFLLLLILLLAGACRADWINLTGAETSPNIAEIYVLDDRVKVVLEIYVQDLRVFEALLPDDWLSGIDVQRPPLEERLRRFAENDLQIVTDTGEHLRAELDLVEPRMRVDRKSPYAGMINPTTRRRVPNAPDDKRVVYAELNYPFAERPESLTFVPPLDKDGVPAVTIGFITYHKAVPVIDFRYLGTGATLNLDWDDPWYSLFDNRNLKRHHKSALMSFLYVEPYEVRHEVLTRVRDLEEWMDLGLRGDEWIEADELESLKQRVGEFFMTRNPVMIDGVPVSPILDRTDYVKVGLRGIQLVEEPERLELSTTIVGVILTYLTPGLPQEVTVDWELFTDQIERIPATAIDPAGPFATYLTADDNVHTWTNFLKNYEAPTVSEVQVAGSLGKTEIPVASLAIAVVFLLATGWGLRRWRRDQSLRGPAVACVASIAAGIVAYSYLRVTIDRPTFITPALDSAQTHQLTADLLKNVYRAFDFREEEDVYDKLALTVDGDLLADIYLQNRRSFAVRRAGGAQAKVKDIQIANASAEPLPDGLGYDIRASWSAMGTVGHWGHTHVRKNLYDGIVTVRAVDGSWKITGLDLLEETRVDPNAPVTDTSGTQPSAPPKQGTAPASTGNPAEASS